MALIHRKRIRVLRLPPASKWEILSSSGRFIVTCTTKHVPHNLENKLHGARDCAFSSFVRRPSLFLLVVRPACVLVRRRHSEARETLEILVNWCDLCLPANEQAFAEANRIKIQHFQARGEAVLLPCLFSALASWARAAFAASFSFLCSVFCG